MVVLTTYSSSGGGQFMPSVDRPCSCSAFTTLHIVALEEGFRCNSFRLLLHASACLAANRRCVESSIPDAGVNPDYLRIAPRGVAGSDPRMDLACQLTMSWRSSRLPKSLGSHPILLPYHAIAWKHAALTRLTLNGTTLYVFVGVRSLASAALAFFMHR
jgi:hypothetical protein